MNTIPCMARLWRAIEACCLAISLALLLAWPVQATRAEEGGFAIGNRELSLIDASRAIKASRGFAGSDKRRIDVKVWYPVARADDAEKVVQGAPFPLLIYSHGAYGHAANNMHMVRSLVRDGYIVAAPDYPLSSREAFTGIDGVDTSDVAEQVKDVSFIIDRLTRDEAFGRTIDPDRIGLFGHSLGAITSYFAVYGAERRDPRIKAVVAIAGGDPVQMALTNDLGLLGTGHAAVSVPVLFLSAEKDVFTRLNGRPYAAFMRVEPPKYALMIGKGTHIWFRDGDEQLPDGQNVDCKYLQPYMPDTQIAGCEERVPLIAPARQQEIARIAVGTFFDAWLKDEEDARIRLRQLGEALPEGELRYEE